MAYLIYKADGTAITVADNAIDTTYYNPNANGAGKGLGTQLLGRNVLNYGAAVAQNLLQLTENFSSNNAPVALTSLQGQLWFNKNDTSLYVNVAASGTAWTPLLDQRTLASLCAINPTVPKDGDIRITGSFVYVYATGSWLQIYPALGTVTNTFSVWPDSIGNTESFTATWYGLPNTNVTWTSISSGANATITLDGVGNFSQVFPAPPGGWGPAGVYQFSSAFDAGAPTPIVTSVTVAAPGANTFTLSPASLSSTSSVTANWSGTPGAVVTLTDVTAGAPAGTVTLNGSGTFTQVYPAPPGGWPVGPYTYSSAFSVGSPTPISRSVTITTPTNTFQVLPSSASASSTLTADWSGSPGDTVNTTSIGAITLNASGVWSQAYPAPGGGWPIGPFVFTATFGIGSPNPISSTVTIS